MDRNTTNTTRDESFYEKAMRKTKEEPLVPFGALLTTGFLIGGFNSFRKGNTKQAQIMMRGRVVAQAITILAMGVGAYLGMKPANRPQNVEEIIHTNKDKRSS